MFFTIVGIFVINKNKRTFSIYFSKTFFSGKPHCKGRKKMDWKVGIDRKYVTLLHDTHLIKFYFEGLENRVTKNVKNAARYCFIKKIYTAVSAQYCFIKNICCAVSAWHCFKKLTALRLPQITFFAKKYLLRLPHSIV